MTVGKNILVLGGGVGGLAAASELRRKLGGEHRITVVDERREHISSSSSLWVMVGWRKPEEIKKELPLLIGRGIEFVNEEILKIDPVKKIVKTKKRELGYDHLVISLGAELFPETVPGLMDALERDAYNVYDLGGVIKLRDVLKNFSKGNVVILICSLPFKCPAAPYEVAFLLNHFFTVKGIRKNVKIKLFTPEALPMGVAGPAVGNMMKGMLENMGIEHNFEHTVSSIDAKKKEITFDIALARPEAIRTTFGIALARPQDIAKQEREASRTSSAMRLPHGTGKTSYDLLIVVPPHKAPRVAKESGLTDNDWVPVDKNTMKTKFESVYAIGDIAKIKLPGEWKPGVPLMLPKAGVFAHYEAKVVAENIANEILGKRARAEYTGLGSCFIEIGYGRAGFGTGNFYALPNPKVDMKEPSRMWHFGKVLFEKYWLSDSILKGPADIALEKWMYGGYRRVRSDSVKSI